MSRRKRGPYNRYLTDPTAIVPRQTRHGWRKRSRLESDLADIEPIDPTHIAPTTVSVPGAFADVGEDGSVVEVVPDPTTDLITAEREFTVENEGGGAEELEASDDDESDVQSSCTPLLYEGAQISEEMGVGLLLSMATRHRLTMSALGDLLKLITMHLPSGVPVPQPYRSVYMLLKSVAKCGNLNDETISHR